MWFYFNKVFIVYEFVFIVHCDVFSFCANVVIIIVTAKFISTSTPINRDFEDERTVIFGFLAESLVGGCEVFVRCNFVSGGEAHSAKMVADTGVEKSARSALVNVAARPRIQEWRIEFRKKIVPEIKVRHYGYFLPVQKILRPDAAAQECVRAHLVAVCSCQHHSRRKFLVVTIAASNAWQKSRLRKPSVTFLGVRGWQFVLLLVFEGFATLALTALILVLLGYGLVLGCRVVVFVIVGVVMTVAATVAVTVVAGLLLIIVLLLLLVVVGSWSFLLDALHFLAVKMVHVSVASSDADAAIVLLVDDLTLDGAAAFEENDVALRVVVVLRGGNGGSGNNCNEN